MTVALKRNVPGYVDELGRFRPIRSASYIGGKSAPRKAKASDRKKYSKAKAGDLGKAKQERALEAPWDREYRLEQEAKAAEKREQDRITRELEREIYGETSGRTSRGKAQSLAQFVRSEGGINTKKTVRKGRTRYGDSLENFTRKGSGTTGLVTTTAGKGKSLDYMHQAARQAGYDVQSMDDLLDALDNEIRSGKKTYSTHGSMTYNPRKTVKKNSASSDLFREVNRVYGAVFEQVNRQLHNANMAQVSALAKKYGPRHPDQAHGITRDIVVHGKKAPAFMKIAKPNPDLLSMFANAAVGIASTLQINEMVKSRKRTPAPKKRGTTKAKAKKRTNPANHTKRFHEMSNVGKAKYVVNFHDGQKTHRDGSEFFDIKIFANKKLKDAFIKSLIAKGYARRNPTQPKVRAKGDLYVLTIGSGDDLISVYLHDGDKDGFSKRFKTMAAAKAYASRNKVKLVQNPAAAKVNGIIKRAWARSRAKAEYARELRLAAAAERARSRRHKAEAKAKANPAGYVLTAKRGENTFSAGYAAIHETISTYAAAIRRQTALRKQGFTVSVRRAELKNPPRRSTNGKKAATRSAKANPAGKLPKGCTASKDGREWVIRHPELYGHNIIGLGKTRAAAIADARGILSRTKRGVVQFKKSREKLAKAPARKNPKSTARRRTFEMFQGRKVTTARPMVVSNHAPANLDQLGDLIELKIAGGPTLKFNGKTAKLCAAGGKLWIAGKRFAKPNPAAKANEINPIGEIDHVVYGTRKPHHGDHNYTHYIHKLGEESGKRPILCVDREGFPVIRGGNYKIEARGIVD